MSDYIPFRELVFVLLPIFLDDDEPLPYHDSILTGQLRYEELISSRNENRFRDEIRMDRTTYLRLLSLLKTKADLKDSKHITAGVKLMIYITVLKGFTNRETANHWQRSGSTIHGVIYEVSKCFISIQECFFIKPSADVTPEKISSNPKFSPYFNNCIGAFDGCHVSCVNSDGNFRNRKGWMSQNVLAVVNFDLKFSFVHCGWEGVAHDGEVLRDSLLKGFILVPEKFYLADAGYALTRWSLTPFRGVRHHLKEWARGNRRPQNYNELYNLRHSSLRNAVERSFGIIKKRFPILTTMTSYPMEIQVDLVVKSCFMIHNFIRLNQGYEDEFDIWNEEPDRTGNNYADEQNVQIAENLREEIAQQMWADYQNNLQANNVVV